MNRFAPLVTSLLLSIGAPYARGESLPPRRNLFQPVDTTPTPRPLTAIPPLERYPLNALTLTAIITNAQGERFASVENPQGIGYKVERGTIIGDGGARVIEISVRGIVVEEPGPDGVRSREIVLRVEG